MKIEVSFAELDGVLAKMGIGELAADPGEHGWEPIDIELRERGVDLDDPSQIVVESDGTLTHKGRRILVYIRDQYVMQDQTAQTTYKFHVANCQTIENMKTTGRFNSRYVASTRTDGKFMVNRIQFGKVLEKEIWIEMNICKNCLGHLNYNGYTNNRDEVFRSFSLEEFFEKYGRTTVTRPEHTDLTAPTNTYSSHQRVFSRICRERAQWHCEECSINLSKLDARKFLHAHHVNGDKSDNRAVNLLALCVDCHQKQDRHSLSTQMVRDFNKYKKSRGLP